MKQAIKNRLIGSIEKSVNRFPKGQSVGYGRYYSEYTVTKVLDEAYVRKEIDSPARESSTIIKLRGSLHYPASVYNLSYDYFFEGRNENYFQESPDFLSVRQLAKAAFVLSRAASAIDRDPDPSTLD